MIMFLSSIQRASPDPDDGHRHPPEPGRAAGNRRLQRRRHLPSHLLGTFVLFSAGLLAVGGGGPPAVVPGRSRLFGGLALAGALYLGLARLLQRMAQATGPSAAASSRP